MDECLYVGCGTNPKTRLISNSSQILASNFGQKSIREPIESPSIAPVCKRGQFSSMGQSTSQDASGDRLAPFGNRNKVEESNVRPPLAFAHNESCMQISELRHPLSPQVGGMKITSPDAFCSILIPGLSMICGLSPAAISCRSYRC